MNTIPCEVIKDLLPMYVEGLTSEETNRYIETHLEKCEDCASVLRSMKDDALETDRVSSDIEVDFLKKNRNRNRKIVLGSLLAALCLAIMIFAAKTFVVGTKLHGATACNADVTDNQVILSGTVIDSIHGISRISFREENGEVYAETYYVIASPLHSGDFRETYIAEDTVKRVYVDGELIWADGTQLRPMASKLFMSQHPYCGSQVDNARTATAMNIAMMLGPYTNELITSEEPYTWRVIVENELPASYSEYIEEDLINCGTAMIACIENLGAVEFEYDMDGRKNVIHISESAASALLGYDVKSCYGDPLKTQDMVLQLGLERFGYRWRPEPEAVQK